MGFSNLEFTNMMWEINLAGDFEKISGITLEINETYLLLQK